MGMKKTIYLTCLRGPMNPRGRMRNPFRTIRAIAEHVTKVACRPDERGIWLYLSAQEYLHTGVTQERFERELRDMVREGILRYDNWNGYSRFDYGWR